MEEISGPRVVITEEMRPGLENLIYERGWKPISSAGDGIYILAKEEKRILYDNKGEEIPMIYSISHE